MYEYKALYEIINYIWHAIQQFTVYTQLQRIVKCHKRFIICRTSLVHENCLEGNSNHPLPPLFFTDIIQLSEPKMTETSHRLGSDLYMCVSFTSFQSNYSYHHISIKIFFSISMPHDTLAIANSRLLDEMWNFKCDK